LQVYFFNGVCYVLGDRIADFTDSRSVYGIADFAAKNSTFTFIA